MEFLLFPPIAFLIYLVLAWMLSTIGQAMAGKPSPTSVKSTAYASGEVPMTGSGAPGYRPFIRTALFFAVLHLGVLVLASGGAFPSSAIYLVGLVLVLLALILG